jgi:mono/diheme cytochrome c family protein
MLLRLTITALAALALAVGAYAARDAGSAQTPAKYEAGKKLYRQFCGQCHALKEARAVGFGSAKSSGPGDLPGPSFNGLRVPARYSVLAITGVWDGHSKIAPKVTWRQINQVANYVQAATRDHSHLAQMPSDAY